MPQAMQPKGDGEYPYSAPFTGLDASKPSIILPSSAQDIQTSPSFAIVRGSIAAPWPYGPKIFNFSPGAGEYLLFVTPSGYVFTNQAVYQIECQPGPVTAWSTIQLIAMPAGAFPALGSNKEIPFVESNGCVYFATQLGIYQFGPQVPGFLRAWSVGFTPSFMTIFGQRMVAVCLVATTNNVTPGTPTGTTTAGSVPAGTYYAVVTAVFPSGSEGPPSAESAGIVLGAPGGITLTWTAVTGASSYNVYLGTAPGGENAVYNTATNSITISNYTVGTVSPPVATPISPWTVAWSAVSTFSPTSAGTFNANPNTSSGVIGGFDVLTNYSQGLPVGIVNLGHSIYIMMTQGIVEMDPAASGTAPFTLYNYWQERIPVGALLGTLDQFGPIACFVTPDNVNVWVPGSQTQIGAQIMPYLRNLFRNMAMSQDPNAQFPLLLNPPSNASFYTMYNELHYALTFNVFGVPPQQFAPPYPNQIVVGQWFGLILDYNFTSQAWTQQVTPPITTKLYQVNGPPFSSTTYTQIPPQSFLVAGTAPQPGSQAGVLVFAPDVFNQEVWAGIQCLGLQSVPQPCKVGFPQTTITSGNTPVVRRVRIEYSMDEMSSATQTAAVQLTVSLQGTNSVNTAAVNVAGSNTTTTLQSKSVTITLNPIGTTTGNAALPVVPYMTSVAYADFYLSVQNPQVSLSWTDPTSYQRLLIHRVTIEINDTQGTKQ